MVEAATYEESRKAINDTLGKNNFAMHMGSEFEPLIALYNLEEIALEA